MPLDAEWKMLRDRDRPGTNNNSVLPPVNRVPSLSQLESLLVSANQRPGRVFDLPILLQNPTAEHHLTVEIRRRHGEASATWSLFHGISEGQPVWSHSCADMAILHSMLLCSFSDEVAVRPERLDSYAASPTITEVTAPAAEMPDSKDSLYGNLSNLPIESLLQTFHNNQSTGVLIIKHKGLVGEIYFDSGRPVHCNYGGITGEAGMIELLLWQEGTFQFVPDVVSPFQTVKQLVPKMLMEGALIADYCKFLDERGVTLDSAVVANPVTQEQYNTLLQDSAPVDADVQRKIFLAAGSPIKCSALVIGFSLTRERWSPILFNLVKNGLLVLAQIKVDIPPVSPANDLKLTTSLAFIKLITRPETGLYTYDAFLHFLELEYARYKTSGRQYSLILIRVGLLKDKNFELLALNSLLELIRRIQGMKRQSDLLCHFETLDLVLLLPETDGEVCPFIMSRIREAVFSAPLVDLASANSLVVSMGSASANPRNDSPYAILRETIDSRIANDSVKLSL
jgi:GGDEF domain-containing protein